MADQRIIINVDSKWLITHLSFEERQIFVFENTWKLRLLTIFDEVGMSQKLWESEVGPSVSAKGKYSWEISDTFKQMVSVYANNIQRMNIELNLEKNSVSLSSHGATEHGFCWKACPIDIDGETTWELDDTTVIAESQFDWRDLELIMQAAQYMTCVTIKIDSNTNDVLWEGFDDKGEKKWAHQNKRLNWKIGTAETKFQPGVLKRILHTMDKPISYGTNTQISILKSKLLMISSENTLAYMSPVIENVESHIDGGLCSDEEVPLVN
tara:strand:- start:102 stop:902 length:801 start_codon:yes stop_codon:yes gene_type:complete